MNANKNVFLAEASSIQSSDIYMTVSMVMLEASRPNLNKVRVTEAFIDDIVANQDSYVTLPLVADTRMLWCGGALGHKYDKRSDTFDTNIIGGFYKFEKKVMSDVPCLVGYARISKRDQETCNAIAKLYAEGRLKFSFEIACSVMSQLDDGTMLIDARPGNSLTGLCVVSQPACENAVAMQLVAEEEHEEENKMNEEKQVNETVVAAEEAAESVQEVVASTTEEPKDEKETAAAEPKKDDKGVGKEEPEDKEPMTKPNAECKEETACGKKPCAESGCGKEEPEDKKPKVEEACGKKPCAETDPEEEDPKEKKKAPPFEKKEEEPKKEEACGKKPCAEVELSEVIEQIKSLAEKVAALETIVAEQKTVIAEMQAPKTVVAESTIINGEDLMADTPTYSLLATDGHDSYTLI